MVAWSLVLVLVMVVMVVVGDCRTGLVRWRWECLRMRRWWVVLEVRLIASRRRELRLVRCIRMRRVLRRVLRIRVLVLDMWWVRVDWWRLLVGRVIRRLAAAHAPRRCRVSALC